MNIIQHHHVPVTGGTLDVVHNVAKDDAVLGGGNFHVSFDVCKVVGCKHDWLKQELDKKKNKKHFEVL